MAELRDLDATDASNTTIGGIGSQGTSAVSGFDNIIRALAGMLKRMVSGAAPLDDTVTFCDPVDTTKRFRFDGGSVTAGLTRVITVPNADVTIPSGTIVTESATQTLTGKTLTSPTITGLDASATAKGLVELATDEEAQTGTDTARAITPANLQAVTATETRKGVVELATTAESTTGTDTARAVTPAGLKAAIDAIDFSPDYGAGNAAISYGAIGDIVLGFKDDGWAENTNYAGSTIEPGGMFASTGSVISDDGTSSGAEITKGGAALSGTWRAQSRSTPAGSNGRNRLGLFKRVL